MELSANLLILSIPIFFILCFEALVLVFESATDYIVSAILLPSDPDDDLSWPSDFDFYGGETNFGQYMLASCSYQLKSFCFNRLKIRRYRPNPTVGDCGKRVECVFCLCDVEVEDEIRELRCDHVFHRACLDKWLNHGGATCPLCREPLVVADADVTEEVVDYLHLGVGGDHNLEISMARL